jgi:hypothetical protein
MGAKIIDCGRGPEIEGTRITVYDVVEYLQEGWHYDQIAGLFRLPGPHPSRHPVCRSPRRGRHDCLGADPRPALPRVVLARSTSETRPQLPEAAGQARRDPGAPSGRKQEG